MRKKLVYLFILILAIVIQTSFLPIISGSSVAGDVVLMAILAWSIIDGFTAFIGWAIIAGILYDLGAYSPIGEHVIIFLLVVYFVSFFSRRLSIELKETGWLLFFIFVIAATLISKSVIALAGAWDVHTFHGYWHVFGDPKSIIVQIVCNSILFFFLFFLLRKIKEFFKLEK